MTNGTQTLSDIEKKIIHKARTIDPIPFLSALKNNLGGFLTHAECRLVEVFIEEDVPSEVINMAIHYILVVQKNAILNKNYFSALMQDWSQKKLTDAEIVMYYVKENYHNKLISKKKTAKEAAPIEPITFESSKDKEIALKRQLDLMVKQGLIDTYTFKKNSIISIQY